MQDHLKNMLNEIQSGTAQLLDVREQGEWDMGHLKLAVLAPLSELSEEKLPEGLDLAKRTYLHCRSGQRVRSAAPILEDMGFADVIPLHEGFDELVEEGFAEA